MMRSSAWLALALLTGCSGMLAPDYHRPAAPVPDHWPGGPVFDGPAAPKGSTAGIGWRTFIVDPRLRQLVEMALANNRDLRIASANVVKAQALYGIARSALFPRIDVTLAGTHSEVARDLLLEDDSGAPRITHSYNATLGFSSYELDFFGRMQNLKDQVLEAYLQTEETRSAAQISLVAAVASSYLALAADQERGHLAHDTLSSQLRSYGLIRRRFELGVASQLDLSQAGTLVDSARVDVATYDRLVAQDLNALNLLVGREAPDGLLPAGSPDNFRVLRELPVGLPSEVLQHRPDILADEHALKADNASIGAARAAFFPSITLLANEGSASDEMTRLFSGGNTAWTFIPQLNLPIFHGGQLRGALASAKAGREIDLAQYEKDIQVAFREVADALAVRTTVMRQLAAQQALTDAMAQSFRLANARYLNGIDSFLAVLDAQRALYAAQQNLIGLKFERQNNLVILYKVMGGGVFATDVALPGKGAS